MNFKTKIILMILIFLTNFIFTKVFFIKGVQLYLQSKSKRWITFDKSN